MIIIIIMINLCENLKNQLIWNWGFSLAYSNSLSS